MPITNMRFSDGVFFCKEEGRIDENDAQAWADAVAEYAMQAAHPIVALVDATDATYITASARRIFARASGIANLQCAAVATSNFQVAQNAKLIGIMSVERHTHVFDSVAEAEQFAQQRAKLLQDTPEANV